MTTKRILYTRVDGGVDVLAPTASELARLMFNDMTESQAIDLIKAKDVPSGAANVEVVEAATLPTDKSFRNAWVRPGFGPPAVDMPKARIIQQGRIEAARKDKMRDLLLREALGENVTALKAQVNAVNAAALVAGAANEAALKAVIPSVLAAP